MTAPTRSATDVSRSDPARWRVLALLMALCFISHLSRVSMNVAGKEKIMDQFGISPTKMGLVYTAFLVVYTIFMIPGGLFIDRVGARRALIYMGLGSAAFGALTGAVGLVPLLAGNALLSLLIIRSLMGFFTTPLHPASARAVSNWFPEKNRSWANSLVTGAALLGIAANYKIVGALIDQVDWPMAFVITGACTAGVTLIWAMVMRDESSAAAQSGAGATKRRATWSAWASLLKNRNVLLLTASYAAVGYFQYLFFYWILYYFDNVLHVGKEQSRFLAGLPTLAMAVGMPLGGWISDRLRTALGPSALGLVAATGMVACAVCACVGLAGNGLTWVAVWFTASLFALGLSEGPFWTAIVDTGGSQGGTAAAIMNTGGNGIGLLAPTLTPLISEYFGWNAAILVGAGVCVVGAVCWIGVRSTGSISRNAAKLD